MDNIEKISKLEKSDLKCNIFTVYDFDAYTIQELLCMFFNKINECIDLTNSNFNLCQWLIDEGLKQEIAEKLVLWLNDGTLNEIIGNAIVGDLKTKLKNDNQVIKVFARKSNLNLLKTSDITYYQAEIKIPYQ